MLNLTVKPCRVWNEKTGKFVSVKNTTKLRMEHSLKSISEWESIWHVPFIDKNSKKTKEQILSYIKCMTITRDVDDPVFLAIINKPEYLLLVTKYIKNPSSAVVWYSTDRKTGRSAKSITSERIYYKIFRYRIDAEVVEKWHISRLMNLLMMFDADGENSKIGMHDYVSQRNELNELRKAKIRAARGKK